MNQKFIDIKELKIGDFFSFEDHPVGDIFLIVDNDIFVRIPNKFCNNILCGKNNWDHNKSLKKAFKLSKKQIFTSIIIKRTR